MTHLPCQQQRELEVVVSHCDGHRVYGLPCHRLVDIGQWTQWDRLYFPDQARCHSLKVQRAPQSVVRVRHPSGAIHGPLREFLAKDRWSEGGLKAGARTVRLLQCAHHCFVWVDAEPQEQCLAEAMEPWRMSVVPQFPSV